jgi:serine/threonine-protein kinase
MMISDRYEVIDKVGSGGMADVYKAKDHRLNRFVAVKVLKQEYGNDAKFVAKFRAEAQSVAGLSHPNIVNVYDVDEDDSLNYIVMELVEGITLKKFIEKKGKLEVSEAVGIAVQIAQGMEAAHDNHIIHRDIKPQNIIISKEGKVKVTDFGIAKAATSNTITSNAMGSVHYISPEQARGGYSDEKSDIYSLGVTLYEMLSGSVPFEGDSTVAVALSHIQEDAQPLRELDGEIPLSLSKIVQKCMQKKPELRYLTAASLIADLKRAVQEPDGAYVKMESIVVDASPTINISDEDLSVLKEASRTVEPVPEQELEEDMPYDEDAIDPKLERILKVCSAVVAVIIIVGVILIVGKFSGWWGTSGGKEASSQPTEAPEETEAAADDGQISVPGIVGKSLEDAEQLLNDSKLHWQLKPVESDEEPNIVTDQEPAEGEIVDEGSRVTIYYSQGDTGVTVPDVAGKTESDARTALESANLSAGTVTEEYSSTVDKGKVIRTDPVVGSSVEEGTTVNLVVSKGAEGDQSVVPNLVGKKESVALERLQAAGLKGKATYIYSDQTKDKVVSQTQRSGQTVERGTTIEYSVSLGPKETPTATPKAEVSYRYDGSVTISTNPFDSPDEDPATIKLVLSQDGKSQTVWKGTLSYEDFPKEFPVQGWSENTGTITVCKNDQDIPGSYSVDFKKTAK